MQTLVRSVHLCADVQDLNASKGHGGRPEGLEPDHRSHLTLDASMVLFDDVVEVLDLPELNLSVMLEVVARDRRGVPVGPPPSTLW